jgi:putative transposase
MTRNLCLVIRKFSMIDNGPFRSIFEAILYVLRTGCQWRLLPSGFPPRTTVHRWFLDWTMSGLIDRINHSLVMEDRLRAGREASPTAAIIDSQSVKTSETAGFRGYDGGKKINGIKRHLLVDTEGRLLVAAVSAADLHDSKAAAPLLRASRRPWPFVQRLFADSAYRGATVANATVIDVTVVTGPPNQKGFIVQKRRWVVERTIAWINRNRRLSKNYERLHEVAAAFVVLAAAMILVRRLAGQSTE